MITSDPIRVLIVDDHPSLLWGLQKLIESAAPEIELAGAANCRHLAMPVLLEGRVNIVLLDIQLGDECGIDMIPDIARAGAKTIVLSSSRDPEIRRQAIMAGASGFIPKITAVGAILEAIRHVHAGRLWLQSEDMASLLERTSSSTPSQSSSQHVKDQLTAAERKVVAAVVMRRSSPNKVIADALSISTHTLRNHLASVYSKLNLHSRLDLVFYAKEHRLDDALSNR